MSGFPELYGSLPNRFSLCDREENELSNNSAELSVPAVQSYSTQPFP